MPTSMPYVGTAFASLMRKPIPVCSLTAEETAMAMGNRAIWAILWVIGIPLPILIVLYFLTGGGCQ
jgi:hypothetical protein